MDNQQAKFAYLAGLIDGEGCLDFQKNMMQHKYRSINPRMRIVMTDFAGLDQLKNLIKETGLPHWTEERKRITDRPEWSNSWGITIQGHKRVSKWIESVAPYSIFKKPQWETLKKFILSREQTNPTNQYSKTKGYTEKELELVNLIKTQKKQKASTTTR